MNKTMKAMLNSDIDMAVASDITTIWSALEDCPSLPKGMVMWRAVRPTQTVPTRGTTRWMSVSATVDGAEAWAKKNLTDGKATICKIIVADDSVHALAVGADGFYEMEKEILVAPGFKIVAAEETHGVTGNDNPIMVFKITG